MRVSALFSVPGDGLAGAAAAGYAPNRGTALAVCSSLCLYEAGMALNDWSDRHEDAAERPHRPLPSGRISPAAALGAAAGLTAAGLGLAAAAGRPALLTATTLAGTVWAYDLRLKHTAAGPAAMAAARGLDLLLGAVATVTRAAGPRPGRPPGPLTGRPAHGPADTRAVPGGGLAPARAAAVAGTGHAPPGPSPASPSRPGADTAPPGPVTGGALPPRPGGTPAGDAARRALSAATLLAAHTAAVTLVSRRETTGGSTALPLGALAVVAAVARSAAPGRAGHRATDPGPDPAGATARPQRPVDAAQAPAAARAAGPERAVRSLAAAVYGATAARPFLHAALNPSPHLYQRAVGGGIRAMIPLQAALAARAGRPGTTAALLALVPPARRLSRKVSPT
ncbi:UbiA family prenyltransferase [Streptomyces zingiberis]|uniref:UbiA family prenyltransferase n=1 Tax=Streptomyces zingiberis TaxID=2053010 RepID=UPI0035D4823A